MAGTVRSAGHAAFLLTLRPPCLRPRSRLEGLSPCLRYQSQLCFTPSLRRSRVLLGALLISIALAAGALGYPHAAQAATITVNTTADEFNTGPGCSLREAIRAANTDAAFGGCPAGSGADTITFCVNGTFLITINPGPDENANAAGDFDLLSRHHDSGQRRRQYDRRRRQRRPRLRYCADGRPGAYGRALGAHAFRTARRFPPTLTWAAPSISATTPR